MAGEQSNGPRWVLIAGAATLISGGAFSAMAWPQLACVLRDVRDPGDNRAFDAVLSTCREATPLLASPTWLLALGAIGAIAALVALAAHMISTRRASEAALESQRARRAVAHKQSEAQDKPADSPAQSALPRPRSFSPDASPSIPPAPATPLPDTGGIRVIADASDDPLAGLDAIASAGSAPDGLSAPSAAPIDAQSPPPSDTRPSFYDAAPPRSVTPPAMPAAIMGGARFTPRSQSSDQALLPDINDEDFFGDVAPGAWQPSHAAPNSAPDFESHSAREVTPTAIPGFAAPDEPDALPSLDDIVVEPARKYSDPFAELSHQQRLRNAVGDDDFNAPGLPVGDEDTLPAMIPPRQLSDSMSSFDADGDGPVLPSTPVVGDGLVLDFRTPLGAPIDPRTVLIEKDGVSIRAWVGATETGLLHAPNLEPGEYTIRFEDGGFLGLPGDEMKRSLTLPVTLEPVLTPTRIHTPEPVVLYVSSYGDAANATGQRNAPFPSLRSALEHAVDRRRAGDPTFHSIELRVDPTARLPSGRHGLANGPDAKEWFNWWRGDTFDATVSWTRPAKHGPLRDEARDASALAEELTIKGIDDLRIVNSAYAGMRERVAMSPGFEVNIEHELASIPLAQLGPPPQGPRAGFRLEIVNSERVHIEGVHLLGCEGQSGLAIRESNAVTVRRCWIELFSSGPTKRSGTFGVGRGVQVDDSGGSTPDTAVLLETCDIGWNTAARRSVPIRGAGVAVSQSNLELTRCHVHDNVATQAPPGFVATNDSTIRGVDNHRASNEVLIS